MNLNDLKNQIFKLYEEQEDFLKNKYDRSLSFQDGLFDRFERAEKLGFGEKSSIYNSALVYGDVQVSAKTWIGPYVILDGSGGGINIGSYCSISAGVHIYTHDSIMWALSGGTESYHQGGVTIGNNTYIGAQSIIRAGVKIGNRCLIGANSFVNKDIAAGSIVVGNPGKVVGKIKLKNDKIFLEYC